MNSLKSTYKSIREEIDNAIISTKNKLDSLNINEIGEKRQLSFLQSKIYNQEKIILENLISKKSLVNGIYSNLSISLNDFMRKISIIKNQDTSVSNDSTKSKHLLEFIFISK